MAGEYGRGQGHDVSWEQRREKRKGDIAQYKRTLEDFTLNHVIVGEYFSEILDSLSLGGLNELDEILKLVSRDVSKALEARKAVQQKK